MNFDENDKYSIERTRYYLDGIIELYSLKIFDLFIDLFSNANLNVEDKKAFTLQRFEEHLVNFIEIIKSNPNIELVKKNNELIDDFINIDFGSYLDKKYIISRVAEYDFKLATSSKFKFYLSNIDENEELFDYSNTKATEKIIYLQRLGVIDYLKEKTLFQTSTNKLAEYLSAVTDERADTLQSYLNPLVNKNASQKNNPLKTISSVNEVENKLISMGFKDSDFFK